ncbi:hypothetical protein KFL_000790320 [Klebsormidium nitens]|uniref:Glucose/Sorbosone dehydrogenase domain-containing protein n=1 Tax=Klebsormidium nitens TaxID=105231 RepID=A0A1Y1HXY8_KLENI|nr:hypothetical protein KFL_000790320 [Klebsormidium nitens]|eukprot:GAQ81407.1 hypothetical protein KFL_000790320 [Klebsormidium nitens]
MPESAPCSSLYKVLMARGALLQLLSAIVLMAAFVSGHQLCTNLEGPTKPSAPLTFCSAPAYPSLGCCSPSSDQQIQAYFTSLNVTDAQCSAVLQQLLCAQCDPWASHLLGVEQNSPRVIPYLCNTTSGSTTSYCAQVYSACASVPIANSPFAQTPGAGLNALPIASSTPTTLSDLFPSQAAFCNAFSASSFCYDGAPYVLPPPSPANATSGMCVEKIGTGTYINMAAIPGSSNLALVASQYGRIRLVTLPAAGSGLNMTGESGTPFLDLSQKILAGGENGLIGLTVHPNYTTNGKFYVTYTCNSTLHPDCAAPCECDPTRTACDPSQLPVGSCTQSTVIAEYTAPNPLTGPSNPTETRRILTLSKPYANNNGGQLLFGPDGYLYSPLGDGGGSGDPWNFAQTRNTVLGKVIRIDVNTTASNPGYVIPPTNPYYNQTGAAQEVFATGFKNPWRCNFDSARPTYLFCGDVGQTRYEEVNLVTKGGNYGWRTFEGPTLYTSSVTPPGGTTPPSAISVTPPVMSYTHDLNPSDSASITGGYVYRGASDTCNYGRYIFADLYGKGFTGLESPADSGNFTMARMSFLCAGAASPMTCGLKGQDLTNDLQYIFSFGEDINRDMYLLTLAGVFRVTSGDKCGITSCSQNVLNGTAQAAPAPALAPTPLGGGGASTDPQVMSLVILFLSLIAVTL